jgi:hypothetical protein
MASDSVTRPGTQASYPDRASAGALIARIAREAPADVPGR